LAGIHGLVVAHVRQRRDAASTRPGTVTVTAGWKGTGGYWQLHPVWAGHGGPLAGLRAARLPSETQVLLVACAARLVDSTLSRSGVAAIPPWGWLVVGVTAHELAVAAQADTGEFHPHVDAPALGPLVESLRELLPARQAADNAGAGCQLLSLPTGGA